MKSEDSLYIDHEVRIQLIEKMIKKMESRFDQLEEKIDKNFRVLINMQVGIFVAMVVMFGGMILTKFF